MVKIYVDWMSRQGSAKQRTRVGITIQYRANVIASSMVAVEATRIISILKKNAKATAHQHKQVFKLIWLMEYHLPNKKYDVFYVNYIFHE